MLCLLKRPKASDEGSFHKKHRAEGGELYLLWDDPSMKYLPVLGTSESLTLCGTHWEGKQFWNVFAGPVFCSFLSTQFHPVASVINNDRWAGRNMQSLALGHSDSYRTTQDRPCDWCFVCHKTPCLLPGVVWPWVISTPSPASPLAFHSHCHCQARASHWCVPMLTRDPSSVSPPAALCCLFTQQVLVVYLLCAM